MCKLEKYLLYYNIFMEFTMKELLKLIKFLSFLFLTLIVGIYVFSFIDWVLNHNNHDYNSKDQYCSCSM